MRQLLLTAALGLGACTETFHSVGFYDRVDTMNAADKSVQLLATGDLTGDGRADVVLVDKANNLNEVSVLFGKGDGNFSAGVSYPLTDNNSQNHALVVGDLNGDNRADVVVSGIEQRSVQVFLNQGDGRLVPVQQSPGLGNCTPSFMALYDMTSDGRPDLVIGCGGQQNNLIQIYKNQDGGGQQLSFGGMYSFKWTTATTPQGMADPAALGIAVGELNGDSTPDIAVATEQDLRILNSPKESAMNYQVTVPLSVATGAVALGDVNGNGVTDISALQRDGKAVQVFEYATGGAYNQVVSYPNIIPATDMMNMPFTSQLLKVADFSSDGKSDLLMTLGNPSEIKVTVSRGEVGMVVAPVTLSYKYPAAPAPGDLQICDTCLSLGDVNGDGKADLVMRNNGKISVLINASR